MPRIAFTVESDVPPERVLAAATDFTERKPTGNGKGSALLMRFVGKRLLTKHLEQTLAILERQPEQG
jgi:hypothetical protein